MIYISLLMKLDIRYLLHYDEKYLLKDYNMLSANSTNSFIRIQFLMKSEGRHSKSYPFKIIISYPNFWEFNSNSIENHI